MTPPDRFKELRELLRAYEWTGHAFDDTVETPGIALSAYMRTASYAPERVTAAVREIDDLLTVGLFNDDIADDVDLLPHIDPPRGIGVEDCLRVVRQHLEHFLAAPPAPRPSARPKISWEWRERFPALAHFLGAYFYQGSFEVEYQSHAEAVDDYLSAEAPEDHRAAVHDIDGVLAMNPTDDELKEGARVLGLREPPPEGVSLRQWLTDIQGIITHHLRT
ncbi:contact-dependent growth inhibition system immunity protein [Streptomyces sp. NPDC096311]|uniref:contact-dependent growth inhibition system immunity protein n=1 Tax=Streptomyces sp. NPDC096311 TaxID=3366083 RepID=UPI003815ABC3